MPYEPSRDPMHGRAASLASPTRLLVAVTPSDTEDLAPYAKALWAYVPADVEDGVATVRITPVGAGDEDSIEILVPSGLQPLPPCQVRRVWASGTTGAGVRIYALCDR